MSHIYKRRTFDEAVEMARIAFKESASLFLTTEELNEFSISSVMSSGTPSEEWEKELGFKPATKMYYEIHLYKPSNECPYIEKSFAKILVSRNREEVRCEIIWKPIVQAYVGPWFS